MAIKIDSAKIVIILERLFWQIIQIQNFKIDNSCWLRQWISRNTVPGYDLFNKMNDLCSWNRDNPKHLWFREYGDFASKYNNTQDVVFGSVVSGRPGDLLGNRDRLVCFINTHIPVRVKYNPGTQLHFSKRNSRSSYCPWLPLILILITSPVTK
jgi:hypothetical protein